MVADRACALIEKKCSTEGGVVNLLVERGKRDGLRRRMMIF